MPVISYLVKYHLESEVVEYLSKKGSISKVNSCLVNGGSNFNPDSLVSVYTILFDCLKGSTAVSGSVLLDDFEQADGYRSLTSLLLTIETRDEATCSAIVSAIPTQFTYNYC
jgi:hypothetical protein